MLISLSWVAGGFAQADAPIVEGAGNIATACAGRSAAFDIASNWIRNTDELPSAASLVGAGNEIGITLAESKIPQMTQTYFIYSKADGTCDLSNGAITNVVNPNQQSTAQ